MCVVVPLRCATDQALRCLEAIAAQGEDARFEVIVVEDAAPGLRPLLSQLDGDVQVIHSDRRRGLAGCLELALPRVRADIVAILRDAAVPRVDWLPALLDAMADPAVAVAFSTIDDDAATPALRSPAAAVRTDALRAVTLPGVDDDLLLGTLALSLCGAGGEARVIATSSVSPATPPAARHAPGTAPELTIVVPTLDAAAERVRRCLHAVAVATSAAHEVLIVENGAPPQGFSSPVNAGIRAADTPYVVVMNDDVEPEPGWWEPLRAVLDAGAAVAFPRTLEGAMRTDFAAWCFALSRDTIEQFGHARGEFFDPALVIWFQDTDLLARLVAAGRPPVLVAESCIRHGLSQTLSHPDPRLRAWIETQVAIDQQRFAAKHPTTELVPMRLAHA